MSIERNVRELADLYEERTRVQKNILFRREILKQNELILKTVEARIKKITSGKSGKIILATYKKIFKTDRNRDS